MKPANKLSYEDVRRKATIEAAKYLEGHTDRFALITVSVEGDVDITGTLDLTKREIRKLFTDIGARLPDSQQDFTNEQ